MPVVIVGGGLGGLVAANRVAELGGSVVVLERGAGPDYPCNSRVATGALNFAHCNPELPPEQLVAAIMGDTEGYADPALARALADVAGRGLRFLAENGARLERRELQNKQSWLLSPARSFSAGLDWQGRGADVLLQGLEERLIARGGTLLRDAHAVSLIEIDGEVAGVNAVVAGAPRALDGSAVVLADGGFQGNADMVGRTISPHPNRLVQRSTGTGRGDGIRMAAERGARLVDMNRFYGHLQSRDAMHNAGLWPYPTLDSLTGASILLDRSGRRLFDEGLGGILLSNLIAATDDPRGMTIIFDEAIWQTTGFDEVVPANPHLPEAGGTLHRADTLEALADLAGLPAAALAVTVATYNEAVREDRQAALIPPRTPGRRFGVARAGTDRTPPRVIAHPPFYAAPLCVGITCTTGGILIDPSARVLHESGNHIANLYAVGSNVGGIEGGPAAGYIGGLAKAFCTGLIAAETIMRPEA